MAETKVVDASDHHVPGLMFFLFLSLSFLLYDFCDNKKLYGVCVSERKRKKKREREKESNQLLIGDVYLKEK